MLGCRGMLALIAGLAALALLVGVLIGGAVWVLSTESGLRWAVDRAHSLAGGKLKLEGAGGSLAGATRIARLTYSDSDLDFIGENIEFTWSPRALFSRSIVIDSLSAARVTLNIKPGDGVSTPPRSLALPWTIDVRNASVDELLVASGENHARFARLLFHYAGGDQGHSLDDLAFHSEWGDIGGRLALDAAPPFAATGTLTFQASDALKRARATLAIHGDLTTLALSGQVQVADARGDATARVSPFDPRWLRSFTLSATTIDLSVFDAAAPRTALAIQAEGASGERGHVLGKLAFRNADPGPADAGRLPVSALSSSFDIDSGGIALDSLEASLGRAGRLAGTARVTSSEARWSLSVRELDLKDIASRLNPTRLAGVIKGQLRLDTGAAEGTVSADVREAAVALSLDATLHHGAIDVRRFRAEAHGGSLEGTAALASAGNQAFTLSAQARALNPAAFGNFPQASISALVAARGELRPSWQATVKLDIAEGSRLRGLPLTGAASLSAEARRVHDIDVNIAAGSNRVTLAGGFGKDGDVLTFTLDASDLKSIDPRLGGRLHASGNMGGGWDRPSIRFSASGESLLLGTRFSAATLAAEADIGAAATKSAADRSIKFHASVSRAHADAIVVRSASADIAGTVGQHDATLTLAAGDSGAADSTAATVDITAHLAGGWVADASGGRWSGRVVTLNGRGPYRLSLSDPAELEAGPARVALSHARGTVEGGSFAIEDLRWEDGRLSSRGDYSHMPAAPLLALSATDTKLTSTLTLSGRWNFAAAPRLSGSLTVFRDDGDLAPPDAPRLALGLSRLDLAATATDDRVHATLVARSRLADADIDAELDPSSQEAGRLNGATPLIIKAHVDTASLRALQSLMRTNAVLDGKLTLDVAGHGTLSKVQFSGNVAADGVTVEALQYGVFLKDGLLRASLSDDQLAISELSLTGGDGHFRAHGTVPSVLSSDGVSASITWSADKFALFNRPHTQLVLSGEGTLALKDKVVTLTGAIKADRGYFELPPSRPDELGSDVVVRGRERARGDASSQRLPFAVDAALDFGDQFVFIGQGFNSGLTGKLHVRTSVNRELVGDGTISAVRGTYTAFGQRLAIDRGRLYFNGPLNNPGIDVLRNAQEPGSGSRGRGHRHRPGAHRAADVEPARAGQRKADVAGSGSRYRGRRRRRYRRAPGRAGGNLGIRRRADGPALRAYVRRR